MSAEKNEEDSSTEITEILEAFRSRLCVYGGCPDDEASRKATSVSLISAFDFRY
jgi:hypothetical protein